MFESLLRDERAIEGLPIRLVIALVVGVASLSVMMSTLGGINALGVTELDAQPNTDVVEPGSQDLTVTVVDSEGSPISNATVVATGGSAQLANVTTATTNASGMATLRIDPSLGPNQDEGTVELDVKPPAGGQYADRRSNANVLVVSG
jgi:hypothetical protein